ncbi:MAG: ABC transporter ATP-binding protein [Micrococcales bacterium]|nr:ABC transporter ATP-binding protein [Micrococcales bacterium]
MTKVYDSGSHKVVALDGVDLDIVRGEVTVVLGPSGSGKSTVLNLLGGMDRPTSGTVLCGTTKVHALTDDQLTRYRRDQVGFVFQHYNLIPTLTAAENVGIGSVRRGHSGPRPMDPREALAQLGLGDRAGSFPYELSGGQMQRVAIARALAKRPALLLADEPTGALDSRTGVEVMEALVAAAQAAAVVVVTHNQTFVDIADQVVVLRDGHVVRD